MDRLTKRNEDGSVGINAFRYYNYQDFQKLASKLADYEDIGTVEYLNDELYALRTALDFYQNIGSVTECRKAVEQQTPKKVNLYIDNDMTCPECGKRLRGYEGIRFSYCKFCGQALER